MYPTKTKAEKLKLLLSLLLPIFITQVAMYAMNFFDTFMSGRHGTDDLAGVAIGSGLWVPVSTGLNGILLALTPMVSHLLGADEKEKIPHTLLQAVYLSVAVAFLVLIAGAFLLDPILDQMKLKPHVHKIAENFLKALAIGIFPLFVYGTLRCFIDAHGMTRLSMLITLSALPINALFNYVFIFGKFGFPELGGVGAGVATALTYWIITAIAFLVIAKAEPFRMYHAFRRWPAVSLKVWKDLLKTGVPIGLAIFFETSIFSAVTLLMSAFDTVVVAGHQAAMNFASFLYMVPLSISMALTIAVGYEAGARRYKDAGEYGALGLTVALGMAVIFAAALLISNKQVAAIYSKDPAVIAMTAHFLLYATFFQLSDAIQAPIQGALRGYKDVNAPSIITLIVYWVIGLPVGFGLAHWTPLGPDGYWIGLISGLAVGAIALSFRLWQIQKKTRGTAANSPS